MKELMVVESGKENIIEIQPSWWNRTTTNIKYQLEIRKVNKQLNALEGAFEVFREAKIPAGDARYRETFRLYANGIESLKSMGVDQLTIAIERTAVDEMNRMTVTTQSIDKRLMLGIYVIGFLVITFVLCTWWAVLLDWMHLLEKAV